MTTETRQHGFFKGRERGEGSIFTRPGRKNLYVQYYCFGKVRQESAKTDKIGVAKKLLARRIAETEQGIQPLTELRKIKYEALKQRLLDDYRNKANKSLQTLSDGTVKIWGLEHLDSFFGGSSVLSIQHSRLQEFADARKAEGASGGTINRNLSLLRRMLHLIRQDYPALVIPVFPMQKEGDARKGFVTDEQFTTLRSKLPEKLHPLVTFCYYTAVRKGEATSIRWEQVDLDEGVITLEKSQTKNGCARIAPLTQELIAMLRKRFRSGRVFPSTNLTKAWKRATKAAKCPELLFHDLRRSAVRNLMQDGVQQSVVMAISGHKTDAVFRRYNIVSAEQVKEAIKRREKSAGMV